MAIPNKQIGWSQESNLLWYILKQLNKLTSIIFNLKPKYKVYTALLTQSGGSEEIWINSDDPAPLVPGVTYTIVLTDGTADWTNVGAPNNNLGTSFVATGTTPTTWGTFGENSIAYNAGAPVVTVLENTIGNIWWTYSGVGTYLINSNGGFGSSKYNVYRPTLVSFGGDNFVNYTWIWIDTNSMYLTNIDFGFELNNSFDHPLCIEIRVYN
jgi:hypothetical protein